MKASVETNKKFYQNLGKLFYAIAAADNVVRESEIKALKEIVRSEWLKVDDSTDEFNTDSGYQTEIVFDWLLEQSPSPAKCLEEFLEFRNTHRSLFSPAINDLITRTASAIATAFAGENNDEHRMLIQLKKALAG